MRCHLKADGSKALVTSTMRQSELAADNVPTWVAEYNEAPVPLSTTPVLRRASWHRRGSGSRTYFIRERTSSPTSRAAG